MTINDTQLMFWKGFEALTAVSTKMAVFWVVAPCSLVEFYQRFRGHCCLHHQGDVATVSLNLADICDLMVLTFVDSLWKYKYGSDLAVFPAVALFPLSTLLIICG
jgi:hypothetical protein